MKKMVLSYLLYYTQFNRKKKKFLNCDIKCVRNRNGKCMRLNTLTLVLVGFSSEKVNISVDLSFAIFSSFSFRVFSSLDCAMKSAANVERKICNKTQSKKR